MPTNQSQRNISSATFSQSEATPFPKVTVPENMSRMSASRDRLIGRHLPNNLIRSTWSPGSS